jgi:hypothetical protein
MKRRIRALAVVLLLAALVIEAPFAQEAVPEQESWYGDQGTIEFGINGSIQLPTKFTDAPAGYPDDDGTTTVMLMPFGKYFFRDHVHAGAQLLLMKTTVEQEGAEDQETSFVFFTPSIGYTFPLAPTFQLDVTANLGFSRIELQGFGDSSQFSYGFSLMALSPLSESAVIGFGIVLTWYKPEFEGQTEDITFLTRQLPLQVSFYF